MLFSDIVELMVYDLLILGGGPAGAAAGVYAARKKIRSAIITESFGGQSIVSADIQNWIGEKSISGFDLAKNFEDHVRAQSGVDIFDGERIARISKNETGFSLVTEGGKTFEGRTVFLALGSHHKKLGVPGEKEFDGKGVVYCSTCDAPLFDGKITAVVGGGNSALEAVRDLIPYATEIFLLNRSENFRGDPLTLEKVLASPKVKRYVNVEVQKILGEAQVTGVVVKNNKTGEETTVSLSGVFVEIGAEPNSGFVKDLVQLNPRGEVVVDSKTQQTSCKGIWAAGDITDVLYKQNNISAGDAVKAILNIHDHLHREGS